MADVTMEAHVKGDGTEGKEHVVSGIGTGVAEPDDYALPACLAMSEEWEIEDEAEVHEEAVAAGSKDADHADPEEDEVGGMFGERLPH